MRSLTSSLTIILLTLIALKSPVNAERPIITIQGSYKIPIAISSVSGSQSAEIKNILLNNFKLSSWFEVSTPANARFFITAESNGETLKGTLLDTKQKPLFTQSISHQELRARTHQLTDAIVKKITGKPGIASSKVTFISAHSGSKELYIMDIDGFNVRQLTTDKSISLGPKFSHSGTKIAYTSYKSGYPDVWVIDLNIKKRQRVSYFAGINSGAAFSPNDSKIALTLSKDGNTELYTLPANGGSPNRLTRTRGTESSPVWSPFGNEIAYISDDRGSPQLYITTLGAASQTRRVRTNASYTTEPDWSPDAAKIAYSMMVAGQMQIGISNLTTGKQSSLTTGGNCESPSWCRDSRHLIYSKSGKLYLLDSQSKESTLLNNRLTKSSEPHCF